MHVSDFAVANPNPFFIVLGLTPLYLVLSHLINIVGKVTQGCTAVNHCSSLTRKQAFRKFVNITTHIYALQSNIVMCPKTVVQLQHRYEAKIRIKI